MGDDETPRTLPPPAWRAGLEFVELLVKIGLAFAVIGYISLRAHLNSLGIPFRESAPPERYLMEMWSWLVVSVLPLVKITCWLILAGWVAVTIGNRVTLKKLEVRARRDEFRDAWQGGLGERILLFTLLAACIATAVAVESYCQTPFVLTGTLKAAAKEPSAHWIYLGLVVVWLVQSVFWLGRREQSAPPVRGRRTLALLLLGIFSIQLPMIYGWQIRDASYPSVTLTLKSGASPADTADTADGILVFETPERFVVWRPRFAEGEVTSFLREEVLKVEAGPNYDLRQIVRNAIDNPKAEWPADVLLNSTSCTSAKP